MKTKVRINRSIRIKHEKEKRKKEIFQCFFSSLAILSHTRDTLERMKDQSELFKTAKSGLKNSRTLTAKGSQMLLKT